MGDKDTVLVPEEEGEVDKLGDCVTVVEGVCTGEVLRERTPVDEPEMVGGKVIAPPPPPNVLLVPVRVTERVWERDFVTLLVASRVVGRGDLVMDLVAVRHRDEVPETERVVSRVVGLPVWETVLERDRVKEGDLVTV